MVVGTTVAVAISIAKAIVPEIANVDRPSELLDIYFFNRFLPISIFISVNSKLNFKQHCAEWNRETNKCKDSQT